MCNRAQPFNLALSVIIVSKPSAEATQPVRTGRYTPTRRRSSAARNDTHRQADVWPISVYTEVRNRSEIQPCLRRASFWDGLRAGHEGWGTRMRRDTRLAPPFMRAQQPPSCRPRAVRPITYGAPRYRPGADQRTSPETVDRFASSRFAASRAPTSSKELIVGGRT